jgi:ABC-type polysaccharide/polyol phosphate export permease
MRLPTDELGQLWRDRYLLLDLAGREFRRSLSGSALGIGWRFLQPLISISLLTIVFSTVIPVTVAGRSGYGGYALFLCSGFLPWLSIDETAKSACNYFTDRSELIRHTSHSRLLFVVSPVLVAGAMLLFSLSLLLLLSLVLGNTLGGAALLVVPLVAMHGLFLVGIGLTFSTLHLVFRDTLEILKNVMPMLFWVTPIVYHPGMLPGRFQFLVSFNPFSHLLACYRSAILENRCPDATSIGIFALMTVSSLLLGFGLYGRIADTLADRV